MMRTRFFLEEESCIWRGVFDEVDVFAAMVQDTVVGGGRQRKQTELQAVRFLCPQVAAAHVSSEEKAEKKGGADLLGKQRPDLINVSQWD